MENFVGGVIIGAIFAALITAGVNNQEWRVEAVGHGYAHYKQDSSWHWNNEGAQK